MKNWINPFWISSVVLTFWTNVTTASAQVVSDNTLPINSQVTGCPVCIIEGGTVRGVNLFHSFEEFSVQTGGAAFFNNSLDIENILGRVTGSNLSNIDGLLLANGTANLFLINPNGIVFGENAQLNIGGSFVGSTANAIGFGNQGVFSATDSEAPPLLTVNPDTLFFNQLAAQGVSSIEVRGSLFVPFGKSLLLVGGNVSPDATATGELLIDGGTLTAFGGRVELAGVGAPGEVVLAVSNDSLGLNFPDDLARTDISIVGSIIDVREAGEGDIVIYSRDLSIENSLLFAGIFSGFGSVDAQAGDITIEATENITVDEGLVFNHVEAYATGRGGNVRITASSLFVTNGAGISASTLGEGDAGKVVIRATDNILFDGESPGGFLSGVYSTVESGAKGNSGGIDIDSGSLTLTNGARITASTWGEGDAGKVVIRATDNILFDGESPEGSLSGVYSAVDSGAKGNSGGIDIDSGSLTLTNGAIITASTLGEGNAGKVVIRTTDNILFDGESRGGSLSGIESGVDSRAKGNSGGIDIDSGSLTLTNGARITASTFGEGDAGKVVIRATDNILFDGESREGSLSGIESGVDSGAKGNSGGIDIDSGSLTLTNGSRITASTFGEGDAGKVVIRATDNILFDGESPRGFLSGVYSTVESGAKGNSGGIDIDSGSLTLTNGARITASTFGEGDAGKVVIWATDSILLDGENSQGFVSGISSIVESGAKGNSGGIDIDSGSLTLNNGAVISASTLGEGDAGKVVIRATDNILFDGESPGGFLSGIESAVDSGAKGNSGGIDIDSGSLTLTNGARITASTLGEGNAGKVVIRTTDSILFDGESPGGFLSGIESTVELGSKGNSGGIDIDSGSLTLTNGAVITASTLGEGNAGKVVIRATDNILFDGESPGGFLSGIESAVDSGAKGNSGGIDIDSGSLTLTNGARITASTLGEGNAGKVVIRATDNILFDGESPGGFLSGVYSTVESGSKGNSGGIDIDSGSLTLTNGAVISASTLGEGDAGQVVIRATGNILLDGENSQGFVSGISSTVESGAKGNSGGVEIETRSLTLNNGAVISAETNQTGTAGSLSINATESVDLNGVGGLSVEATQGGIAGSLTVNTGRMTIRDGATVSVSSPSGQAGNLTIQANSLVLDQGYLTAETGISGVEGGANISLQNLDTLLMSNESLISAKASGDANGGNIDINSIFLLALPSEGVNGSDIIASAERGDGGRITITGEGIFGIEERPAIPGNRTNDIDASSQFGNPGQVITNVSLDPSRGLTQLPSTLVDPSGQINRTCAASNRQNQFTITGRGGLPKNPTDLFSPDLVQDDFGTVIAREEDKETKGQADEENSPISHPPKQIIEAQGWIIDAEGNVVLTANVPNGKPHGSWQHSVNCQVSGTASQ